MREDKAEDLVNAIIDVIMAIDEESMIEHRCKQHNDKMACESMGFDKYNTARERLLAVLLAI